MHAKKRHTKSWFINRVGKEVVQCALKTNTIKVDSDQHAMALYLTQIEKNYTYNEIK